ncbi:unnamed protein product [Symbiodinium natans]|uniref:Uncharacterized protein n=1 Tax=Symbiodinium natans TaxID=878477 RepID=A0A812NI44_9DINO|nr:unnamed protein product [Symbiodinium natans]
MGSGRADRLGQGQVDLRCLQPSKRGSQQQASVDSFMVVLYNSVAEHLPDKLVRPLPFRENADADDCWQFGGELLDRPDGADDDVVSFLTSATGTFMAGLVCTSGLQVRIKTK